MTIKPLFYLVFFMLPIQLCGQQKAGIEKVDRNPYFKHVLKENGDSLTFYLSEFDEDKQLPLVVYIQGSGYHSLFRRDGKSIRPTSGHNTLYHISKGKARILIIEKPGVEFLDVMHPKLRNLRFDTRFSLESWSSRIQKVIDHVLKTENMDGSSVMLIGHSEGGIVAARVARLMPERISKVCIMAGEGPSQLYSLYAFASSGEFFQEQGDSAEERISYLTNTWKAICKDSTSTSSLFWGFTYLRWHSFLRTSVIEELEGCRQPVLIFQGDEDSAVYPESARVLHLALLSKGVNSELRWITGGDHSFRIERKPEVNGWKMVLEQALDWFIGP